MKNRMGIQAIAIVAMLALVQLTAAGQGRGMRSPEESAKQLKEQLTLTDEQTAKVQKIFEDSRKKMMDMAGSNRGDREAMRKMFTETTAKQDSLIEQLLTKEQLTKFEAVKKERQQRMMQRRGPGGQ